MRIGYARVSSLDQNPDRQIKDLEDAGAELIYVDKVSGKDLERPKLQELLGYIRDTDELVVHSLDRLARSLSDLLSLVETLTQKGVRIIFITENLEFDPRETASPIAKLTLSVAGAFSEFERAMIKRRQLEGIALAKEKGVYKGRHRSVTDEQIKKIRAQIAVGVPLAAAARKVGISRSTAYKYLQENRDTGVRND